MANHVYNSLSQRTHNAKQQHAAEVRVCKLLDGVKQVVAATPSAKRNAAARSQLEYLRDLQRYD